MPQEADERDLHILVAGAANSSPAGRHRFLLDKHTEHGHGHLHIQPQPRRGSAAPEAAADQACASWARPGLPSRGVTLSNAAGLRLAFLLTR